ncbi:helix-turn-helix transcriptional regulator [Lacipirellula sp.]|uniref:helix-turn-helix transcriptional regulator n=1 Tax=Lacipirellula sp. TaxID=2691419 RepID=UPI003D0E644F
MERRSRPAYHQLPERGILVFESHHSSSFSMPPERRTFHKLCWVPVGHGSLEYGQSRVTLARDELIFVPAEATHRFVDDHSAPMTLVMAYFSDEVVQQSSPLTALLAELKKKFRDPFPQVKLNIYRRSGVRDSFKRMLAEQLRHDAESTAMLHAGLLELLVHFLRGDPTGKSAVPSREQAFEGSLEYIDDLFHTPIRVKDLADMCGISSRRYSDIFKQRTGKTVVQYLNQKRVNYAQERLRETGQIMYAAVAAGFSDATHFYRVFKRSTGVTPGQYVESSVEAKAKETAAAT